MSHRSKGASAHTLGTRPRGVGVLSVHEWDAYRDPQQWSDPTECPDCHAVYLGGRWRWAVAPEEAVQHRCPACRRIHDHFPAGVVTLGGDWFSAHQSEVMALIHHHADRARQDHPMQRLMRTDAHGGEVTLETTDMHLAHGLGQAVQSAYKGDLSARYERGQTLMRVRWSRQS
jgi:hypothetical protein